MFATNYFLQKLFISFAIILISQVLTAFGQAKQNQATAEQAEDVVRINTGLVQTDVMVFDTRGRFVNGLRREDFELRIDGKPQAISFFDHVIAGSLSEDAQLAAGRGTSSTLKNALSPTPAPLDRGRVVFFFVDDLHVGAGNLVAVRAALLRYIEREMGQNDEAAITSASGQLGFLQQVTDNNAVLRAAVERLKAHPFLTRDFERPPMSEYQALSVERDNREVIDYFVDELMKQMPSIPAIAAAQMGGIPRSRAEQQVRDRARLILEQAAVGTTNTLSSLESLVRSAGKLSGRKLIFFISDGFFLDDRNSDSRDRLLRITSNAARSSVVIYSIDARGLVVGAPDASSDVGPDPAGRLQRLAGSELVQSQDAMNALAKDTGGRTVFNTNAFGSGISKALEETSAYYLIAWRPNNEEQKSDKFRHIEVSVVGRPDLIVRVRRGFFDMEPASATKQIKTREQTVGDNSAEKISESHLRSALVAPFPERGLPVSLNLTYVNSREKGLTLTVSLQVKAGALSFNTEEGKKQATVNIAGLVYNDEGKAGASFKDRLTINAPAINASGDTGRDLIYSYPLQIPPGLYQVRVGVGDEKGGNVGSAQEWIEIPDLSKVPLALSSLIVSERKPELPAFANSVGSPSDRAPLDGANIKVDHRFQQNSFLRFVVFLYSAARSEPKPDIAVQVQILRDNQPVLTTSQRKVATQEIPDLSRLAYAAEISLEHLPPGRYVLQVTAIDRTAKATASQRTRFEIQ